MQEDYGALQHVRLEFEARKAAWTCVAEWVDKSHTWLNAPVEDLNADDVQAEVCVVGCTRSSRACPAVRGVMGARGAAQGPNPPSMVAQLQLPYCPLSASLYAGPGLGAVLPSGCLASDGFTLAAPPPPWHHAQTDECFKVAYKMSKQFRDDLVVLKVRALGPCSAVQIVGEQAGLMRCDAIGEPAAGQRRMLLLLISMAGLFGEHA